MNKKNSKLTLLIMAYGCSDYLKRSLEFYKKWEDTGLDIFVSLSDDVEIVNMPVIRENQCNDKIQVSIFDKSLPFHKKIKKSIENITTEYVFLIGDDDFANLDFGLDAVHYLEHQNLNFCTGNKYTFDGNNPGVVSFHYSLPCDQKDKIQRFLSFDIMTWPNKKSLLNNWHIYGVHNRQNLLKCLDKIRDYSNYSHQLETYFLYLLVSDKPWLFLDQTATLHERNQIKATDVGGFYKWKGDLNDQKIKSKIEEEVFQALQSEFSNSPQLHGNTNKCGVLDLISKHTFIHRNKFMEIISMQNGENHNALKVCRKKLRLITYVFLILLQSPFSIKNSLNYIFKNGIVDFFFLHAFAQSTTTTASIVSGKFREQKFFVEAEKIASEYLVKRT